MYYLSKDAFLSTTAFGGILLDLQRDKYLGLSPQQLQALQAVSQNSVGPDQSMPHEISDADLSNIVVELNRVGVLTQDAMKGKPIAPDDILPPHGSLFAMGDEAAKGIELSHVINFLIAYLWAKINVRTRSLYSLTKLIREKRCAVERSDRPSLARLQDLVRIYCVIRSAVFASRNACLFDSVTLSIFLSRYEISTAWIFAVRASPFAAHCWIQHGGLVLNDSIDHALAFRPIAAI